MNIFNKVALQGLKKSHTRTFVTIIGVVLSAALITAVATFGVSLLNYMANGAAQKYGGWHVAFLDVDSSFAQEQTSNQEVADTATFENIGYAKLDGGEDPDKPYLFIAGFNQKTFDTLPVTLTSGRLPQNSGEILVSGSVATKGGVNYAVGDAITLAVGSRVDESGNLLGQNDPYTAKEALVSTAEKTYTVVGVCQTPHFQEDSAPGCTLITTTNSTDTTDDFSLFITLTNPRHVHAYASETSGSHAYIFNNDVLRFMGLSGDSGDKLFLSFLYAIGAIVIAIIMIGSIFLIYNSFNISLNERTHQFGILSSVGASAKQLRNSVLFEGLCIGAVGIPIGLLTGIGSTALVISVVAKNFGNVMYSNVPLTLTISVPAMIAAAAVSLVTILISAYIPARKAAATPVMECIRQTNEVKVEKRAVKTSKLARHIYGLEGTLALKNFKRNKKRYLSIVLSLTLSIVLFVSTSAFVTDLQQAAEQTKAVTSYDIGFGAQDMDNSKMLQLYGNLRTADGVTESSYQVVMNYLCTVQADELSADYWASAGTRSADETVNLPIKIQFLDDRTYLKIVDDLGLPAAEYTGQDAKLLAVAKMQDNSNQAGGVSQLKDLFTSSSLPITVTPETNGESNTTYGKNADITCVEIMPPDTPPTTETSLQQPYFLRVMAPYSSMETLVPSDIAVDTTAKGITFQSKNPAQSVAEMKTMIQSAGVTGSYILLNTSEMLEENQNYIFIANVFAYTFIIMISLIAVANVFNTISTNIKLRRRELAMLRSVGMSDRDFNKMMRFECAFYGMRALLFGIPIAVVSSWLIYKGMFIGGMDGIHFAVPWASIGISVFSVLLVIFVTMMYAVSKIKKENIIDALRDDMD